MLSALWISSSYTLFAASSRLRLTGRFRQVQKIPKVGMQTQPRV